MTQANVSQRLPSLQPSFERLYPPDDNSVVRDQGYVCFRFFGPRFFENQDSEISQLSGESTV